MSDTTPLYKRCCGSLSLQIDSNLKLVVSLLNTPSNSQIVGFLRKKGLINSDYHFINFLRKMIERKMKQLIA